MDYTKQLPENTTEMTLDEKLIYVERKSYQLQKMKQGPRYEAQKTSSFAESPLGKIGEMSKAYSLGFEEIAIHLFNAMMDAEIKRMDEELKQMLK